MGKKVSECLGFNLHNSCLRLVFLSLFKQLHFACEAVKNPRCFARDYAAVSAGIALCPLSWVCAQEAENSIRFSAWFHSLLPTVNGRGMFVIVGHNRLLKNASPAANYSILIASLLGNRHNTLLTDNLRLCANMCVSPWLCAWVPSISSPANISDVSVTGRSLSSWHPALKFSSCIGDIGDEDDTRQSSSHLVSPDKRSCHDRRNESRPLPVARRGRFYFWPCHFRTV